MRDFKKLNIWQRGLEFSLQIYEATASFPSEERFGLTSQIRRAATSIPINIAEGAGRVSKKDFAHFLHIAEGSANEVECELIIAKGLNYLPSNVCEILIDEVNEIKKMIVVFRSKLESDFK